MYEINSLSSNPQNLSGIDLMAQATDFWYNMIATEYRVRSKEDSKALPPNSVCRDKAIISSLSDEGAKGRIFLAQICGLPALIYKDSFQIVAMPKYNVKGCQECQFRSVIIVHKESYIQDIIHLFNSISVTIAISSRTSTSGNLLFAATLGREFFQKSVNRIIYSGSHIESVFCILNGRADIAAVDCITYETIAHYFPGI